MKRIGGKKQLQFRTTEKQNTSKRRKILAAFILVTIIISIISVVVLVNEYDLFSGRGDDGDGDLAPVQTTKMRDEVTVLFAGVPTDKTAISFVSYITMDTKKRAFVVHALSPEQTCDGKTLSAIYAELKEEGLTDAVSKISETKIDRYVVLTEKKFKPFMSNLGAFEIDLKQGISYQDGDMSLSLLAGQQTLPGDKLFKYIRYVGMGDSEYAMTNQAEVIGELISQKLNENNTEKGDELFGKLINNADSNITIIDFSKYRDLLYEISKEPKDVSVK